VEGRGAAVSTVALATCSEVPGLDEDGPALLAALQRRRVEAVAAVWDDPHVRWDAFDLVVLRSTWDYAESYERFLAWVDSVPRLLNPPEVVRWSTDKRYLLELAAAGAPVVPSRFLAPGDALAPPDHRFVIKPAVSAGGRHSAAYEPDRADRARDHVGRLHAQGRTAIVQPYLGAIDDRGECGLVYLGGRYSHAFRKASLLRPGAPTSSALYLPESIEPYEPSPAERAAGDRTLASLPFPTERLLYGRVDLAPGPEGPLVLEVELAEPSLYLATTPDGAERFAAAIVEALSSPETG
jgi:glutathione synthase/RimK-type ligase-like ATP-grasp enzyme